VVLRDGATVGQGRVGEATEPDLVHMMAGRAIEQIYPAVPDTVGEVLLSVRGLSHPSEFADVNFDLRRGEILGFYGLVGSGRSEAMLALMGLNPQAKGEITLAGQKLHVRRPTDAIQAGIAYVPEERQRQGGILGMSVLHNFTLAGLAGLARGPWLSHARETRFAQALTARLKVKTASQDTLLSGLSGGNQQKVIIGKWLGLNPRIVILDEPTKGIDVGAKQAVYELIAEMVKEGLSVILVSSELPEVMNLAHRVLVMKRGRVVEAYARPELDAETIVATASGLHAAKAGHLHGMDLKEVAATPLPGDKDVLGLTAEPGEEYAA
jgi:rhamnose transport system ATP-binding protein